MSSSNCPKIVPASAVARSPLGATLSGALISPDSSHTTLKRQCLKPLGEWHDLNAGLLLRAFQVEYELQRVFGPQFLRIVGERATDGAVGSLHFNQPLHSPISCDDEIDFPALFVAQVVELPILDRKSTRLNSSHRCISYAV